ncbi:MAG: hypothetical protein ACLR8P_11220 [Clostridium fessum]
MWMYLTPIFYPLSALPENIQGMIKMFNPMYFYIEQFRYVVLNGGMPDIQLILCGCICCCIHAIDWYMDIFKNTGQIYFIYLGAITNG